MSTPPALILATAFLTLAIAAALYLALCRRPPPPPDPTSADDLFAALLSPPDASHPPPSSATAAATPSAPSPSATPPPLPSPPSAAVDALVAATIVVAPSARPSAPPPAPSLLLVFCHGLGDSGAAWRDRAQAWVDDPALGGRVVVALPSAPVRSVTAAMGMRMAAWYDVLSMAVTGPQDDASVVAAAALLAAAASTLAAQLRLPHPRLASVALGGFSMGGALGLFTALSTLPSDRCAGAVVLSGYLPLHTRFIAAAHPSASAHPPSAPPLPVFQAHGDRDDMVPFAAGVATAKALDASPLTDVTFFTVRGVGHTTSWPEEQAMLAWLASIAPP